MLNLRISLLPFGGNFDPAITLGAGVNYKQKGNFALFQTVQVTGYSTQMIGNGLTLTSSLGYRYSLPFGIFGEVLAGLGASAFYPSIEAFTRNEEGIYTADNHLHLRGVFPIDLQVGYMKGRIGMYVKYRYMFMGPYTTVLIVPLLPVSHIGIGIRYGLNKNIGQ